MRALKLVLAALAVAALAMGPAGAAPRDKPVIRFSSGPQSHADWTAPESSDANRMSWELKVGPAGYAIVDLHGAEGKPAPDAEPYFYFKADREAPSSGGSPRLSILFANGTVADLRPENWDTEWRKVGGEDDAEWDINGGPCGFRYQTDYEEVKTCAADTLVVNASVFSDSWWLHGEYTNWVDQLQWDGFVYSHASDNNNAPAAP
jgi:hypothetical protein